MKDTEIEIQVNIENIKPLIDFLDKNADFQKEICQTDEYFSPKGKKFIKHRPVKEWLRLRNSDGTYYINYKNYYYDKNGKSVYCDEYETKLEDIDKLNKIFKALNYESLVIVDKTRKVWTYKDYEISIDSVKNLGDFVEIEYINKNKKQDPKRITDKMVSFLKDIGCGRIKRNYVGYPFQLMFSEEVKFEEK